jgi:15-cis-phytoene synthase
VTKFENIFKKGSRTYFYSSFFFPKEIKQDVYILYAFVRIIDDFVDSIPQQINQFFLAKNYYYNNLNDVNNRLLDSSKKDFDKTLDTKALDKLVIDVINEFIILQHKYQFPQHWIDSFFESMEMDTKDQEYNTMDDTLKYIYGSASVIGLFMSKILNLPPELFSAGEKLGNAFQYINFIRDIKEDIDLKRCYFPQSELIKYDLYDFSRLNSADDLKLVEANFIAFIRDQIDNHYSKWLLEAESGLEKIPLRYRIPIQTATEMYDWTAKQIYKNPMIVCQKKVKPSKYQVLITGIKKLLN